MSNVEVPIQSAELQELEQMVRQLTLTALRLPRGDERRESLRVIGNFRERVDAIKQSSAIVTMQKLRSTA
jgi:hypothetical protein